MRDCRALLAARDTLAAAASLNWSIDVPMQSWDGVAVPPADGRLIGLSLARRGLTGSIPPELGRLTDLEELVLHSNPTIPDSVLNYDHEVPQNLDSTNTQVRWEPDCSPHPLDVMAVWALYQTIVP